MKKINILIRAFKIMSTGRKLLTLFWLLIVIFLLLTAKDLKELLLLITVLIISFISGILRRNWELRKAKAEANGNKG